MERARLCAATLVAAAFAGGCGGSDDGKQESSSPVPGEQRGILSTLDELQAASRRGDAAKICGDIFTDELAKSIRDASKHSCVREVRETLTTPDARLTVERTIDVQGSRATATVSEHNGNTSKVSFVKDGDRWRIARIEPVEGQ